MHEHLTTRQVADALKVSESSVKRWCDSGAIPTVRTAGGHRRIPIDGLVQFLESSNRRMFDPQAIGLLSKQLAEGRSEEVDSDQNSKDAIQRAFEKSIVDGDEENSRRALMRWYTAEPSFAAMADELIARTFHHIGNRWACDEVEVYQERRGCEICSKLIHELRRLVPDPFGDAPIALGASPTDDRYSLPGQLIELVLRESGWRATNLGTNLPFPSLLAAIRDHRPRLVWITVSHIENRDRFLDEYAKFAKGLPTDVTLVVGGRALDDSIRPQLPFTAHCDNLKQLANLANRLRGGRSEMRASEN